MVIARHAQAEKQGPFPTGPARGASGEEHPCLEMLHRAGAVLRTNDGEDSPTCHDTSGHTSGRWPGSSQGKRGKKV